MSAMATRPHRKRVRHYDDGAEPHELTFSCYRRIPLLTDPWRLEQLSRAFDRATRRLGWSVAAFVFMPEHVHTIVYPHEPGLEVSRLLYAIKRPYSFRVKERMAQEGDPLLDRLTIRQRPGRHTFRFWQEGPGYDRNLTSAQAVEAAIDYLHMNPVRRGLVERAIDYRWSSARWYADDGRHVDPSLPTLSALPPEFFVGRGIVVS